MYKRIYEYFIEEIDAVDNGVNATEEKPKYHVTTTLGGRVKALNPAWNEPKQVRCGKSFQLYLGFQL